MRLYDYDQAAEALHGGYSAETIRAYCDRGILTRGVDFVLHTVWMPGGRFYRIRLITEHGIEILRHRLTARIEALYGHARDSATQPRSAKQESRGRTEGRT